MNLSMSKDTTSKVQLSFNELQQKIGDFKVKRDELNKKTKDYINGLQKIENTINESLRAAKEKYKKKRDYWNNKVKKLKEKKIEYKNILDNLLQEKRKIQKVNGRGKGKNHFLSIKQLERKIDNFERMIETENLEIAEENAIIDKIKELAEEKRRFFEEQENADMFKIERKIEIVKINLNKIYEQLNKWSNKSQDYHSRMLELYDKVRELKENKLKMEVALIENKKSADKYHAQYLLVMNQKKKISKGRGKRTRNTRGKPSYNRVNRKGKNHEMLERLKKDKLATALEKHKAGKKLNLFEARLILEQNKS